MQLAVQVVEGASIPAVAKAALRTGLSEQQSEITKQSKAAAAAVKVPSLHAIQILVTKSHEASQRWCYY